MNMFFLIIMVAVFTLSCGFNSIKDNLSEDNCLERVCRISPETASAIAKGYMCLDYEIEKFEVEVIELSDTYEVRFKRVIDRHLGSGGPVVFLRKSNGERIYVIHSK
jgi:hypothetical protein